MPYHFDMKIIKLCQIEKQTKKTKYFDGYFSSYAFFPTIERLKIDNYRPFELIFGLKFFFFSKVCLNDLE